MSVSAWLGASEGRPTITIAALLVSYRSHGTDWRDYLNAVETALETAASLGPAGTVVPAGSPGCRPPSATVRWWLGRPAE